MRVLEHGGRRIPPPPFKGRGSPALNIMKCERCNFENPPGFRFCGNCGDSFNKICPNCTYENIQAAKFCNHCGAVLVNLCPQCRADNPQSARFCSECGFQLDKVCAECNTINPLYAKYCNLCSKELPELTIAEMPATSPSFRIFSSAALSPSVSFHQRLFRPPIGQPVQKPTTPPVEEKVPPPSPAQEEVQPPLERSEIPKIGAETTPPPEAKPEETKPEIEAEVAGTPKPSEPVEEVAEPTEDAGMLSKLEDYIPPALRDMIYATKGKIEGERKIVTTIFSDVSGFTALSEKYTDEPEEIQHVINECLKRQIDEVYKLEGIPDKVVGDEVMALFGAPITHENDAERALMAAMNMRDIVTSYGEEIALQLDVHIGINTGKVSVGSIGGQKLLNYTVMGDPVNLASRIEHIAEAGEIVVGELTYKLTKALFDFEPPRFVEVKGKTGQQPIYELIGPKENPESTRGIEGLTSSMVGREDKMELLKTCLEKARSADFQIASLIGEAGLGKSRLKREFHKQLDDDFTWIEGRCLSHTQHAAYSVFLSAIKSQFGVGELDAEAEIREKITTGVVELFDGNSEISPTEEILPYIFELMSVKLSDTEAQKVEYLQEEPEELQKQTFAAIRHILMQTLKKGPVVLALEDLHWIDHVSYELIIFLMENLIGTSTLLLCVYRPEKYDEIGDHLCLQLSNIASERFSEQYTEISLKPLSQEHMQVILDSMLNLEDNEESQNLKNMILDKAEGNPFYLEEVIRSLIEDLFLQREEGSNRHVLVESVEDIDVPVGVQAVVKARIDRIQGDPKYTLQRASVIGRIFPYSILNGISPQELNIDENLQKLFRLELVELYENSSEPEYNFQHILTYDTTYDSIIARTKREWHGLVGNYLLSSYPEDTHDIHLDQIVYHYQNSDDVEHAATYLVKAGQKAQHLNSKEDAIAYYSDALDRIPKSSSDVPEIHCPESWRIRLPAYNGLGDVYKLSGEAEKALENYTKFLECSLPSNADARSHPEHRGMTSPDIAEARAAVHRKMGEIYEKSDHEMALEQYKTGLAELDGNSDSPEIARIYTDIGYIYYLEANYTDAMQMYMQALGQLEDTEHYYAQALVYKKLGIMMQQGQSDYDSAIKYYEQSRAILERFNAEVDLATLYNNFGELYRERGDREQAHLYFQRSLQEREKLGDINGMMLSYISIGTFYGNTGEYEDAQNFLEKGLEIAERINNVRKIGESNLNIAAMYLRWEKFEQAIEHLERCLPIFEEMNFTIGVASCLANIGDAYYGLGNLDEALEYQNRALEMGQQLNIPRIIGHVCHNIGRIYLKKQDYDAAIEQFQKVLETVTEEKDLLGKVYSDLGKAYFGNGNLEAARESLSKAEAIFKELDDTAELEKVKEIQIKCQVTSDE